MADAAPVLYVFAVQGKPMYVGKSARSLKQRLYGYKKGGATQRTNIRIRKEIIAQLQQAQKVDIYAFASSESQTLGDFILNIPAALEDDIIRKLRPPWNGRRTEPYRDEAPPKAEESIEPQASTDQNQIAYQSFTVQIGEAYFSQGFFNVPVAHSDKFDRDGAAIRIYAGKNRTPVTGRINRRANNNNTPRIMGGTHLRDWIQANVGKGRLLKVIVEAKNQIALTKG